MRAIHQITALTALGMVIALSTAGCGSAATSPPAGTTAPSSAAPVSPPPSVTPTAATPGSATPSATVPSWPTTPRSGPGSGSEGFLTAIRTGQHPGYDRAVFEFRGGVPGYHVEYVTEVRADASGKLVPLAGHAFLHLVFRPSSAYQTYHGPATLRPGLPSLLQVSAAGDFEGYLSFGLGLSERVGFTISKLSNPSRVVVNIAHPGS
jgi:hypothetical protein